MTKEQTITIYKLPNYGNSVPRLIKSADIKRGWMQENNHFYRCLPMTIANQNGWFVESPSDFKVTWLGDNHPNSLHFWIDHRYNTERKWVDSLFGYGIFTFFMDFIVRTPPGVNLLVRGAPNFYVDGAHPLEGVVETDWLNYSFTMNWKITSPNKVVNFKKGDPICYFHPVPHDYSEKFNLEIDSLENNPELMEKFQAYDRSRHEFRSNPDPKNPWQGHYFRGEDVSDGCPVSHDQHSTKLNISEPKFKAFIEK